MLIMPPIEIYVKSYNATRSHASNQSPEIDTRQKKIIHMGSIKSLGFMLVTSSESKLVNI